MKLVECRCGQVFFADGLPMCSMCAGLEAKADPLMCRECGTRLLRSVPDRTCGLCTPSVYERALAAVA